MTIHSASSNDVWTRVSDDTGGGDSLTRFPLLYFHGDDEIAARAIESVFGVKRDDGTPMYGQSLGFSEAPTLAEASWHERGCLYDQPSRRPIESPSGQSWRPYFSEDLWRSKCVQCVDEAIAHSQEWRASRHGKMFLCARPESLALAITCPSFTRDDERACAWSRDLLLLLRAGIEPGPNHGAIARAMAWALSEASLVSMARAMGDQEAPESWLAFADEISPSDFSRARLLGPASSDLDDIDWAHLRLAFHPESRPAGSSPFLLDGLDQLGIDRMRLLTIEGGPAAFDAERSKMLPRARALLARAEIELVCAKDGPLRGPGRL